MIEDFSYYLQTLIHIKRLELIFCIMVSLFIGLIIGICIVVVSTPKPTSIKIAMAQKRGINNTEMDKLERMSKWLNPFGE